MSGYGEQDPCAAVIETNEQRVEWAIAQVREHMVGPSYSEDTVPVALAKAVGAVDSLHCFDVAKCDAVRSDSHNGAVALKRVKLVIVASMHKFLPQRDHGMPWPAFREAVKNSAIRRLLQPAWDRECADEQAD